MKLKAAVEAVNRHGILLVFPANNAKEPASLWSVAYPRSPMRWEWDESGDDRVARLWHLREELSRSRKVIYAKWLQGRATCLSPPAFRALYRLFRESRRPLSADSRRILELLEESSPRSTREIKKGVQLQGRLLESTYNRAMKDLWTRLQICAFGEIDEGSFPSLAIGASRLLFEAEVDSAEDMTRGQAKAALAPILAAQPKIAAFLSRALRQQNAPSLEE